jgi:predicted MFS family arabinose efflux permease
MIEEKMYSCISVQHNLSKDKESRIFDLNLLKDSTVVMYCFSCSLTLLGSEIIFYYLPDMMMVKDNFTQTEAGNIIPIIGFGRLLGGIFTGIIMNYVKIQAMAVTSIVFIFLGVCCIGFLFCYNYVLFSGLSFVHGMFLGATIVLIPLTLIELFEIGSVMGTFGLVLLCTGITLAFGLPLNGYLINELNLYSPTFIVASVCYLLGSILTVILIFKYNRK